MKHKFIAFLLLLTLAATALTGGALAAGDPVDDFAGALGRFETTIQVPVRDFDALMQETFQRYPELFLYYGGCTYLSVPEGLELEIQYQNTDVPRDEITVVTNDQEMMAAMGLTMAYMQRHSYIVASQSYVPDNQMEELMAQLAEDYYLIWMGMYGYSYPGQTSDQWGIRWYDFQVNYWEDADQATVAQWRDSTEAALLQLSTTLFAQDMPDYEKALLAHDFLPL